MQRESTGHIILFWLFMKKICKDSKIRTSYCFNHAFHWRIISLGYKFSGEIFPMREQRKSINR